MLVDTDKRINGTSSERAALLTGNLLAGTIFQESDTGSKYEWDGDSWIPVGTGGSVHVYGLARSAVLQGAGTYNATEILGYRVLVAGSTAWTISPVSGVADISVPQAAMIVGEVYPEHLDSITVGTGGSVIVYIP